jgi:hypothetical protein
MTYLLHVLRILFVACVIVWLGTEVALALEFPPGVTDTREYETWETTITVNRISWSVGLASLGLILIAYLWPRRENPETGKVSQGS